MQKVVGSNPISRFPLAYTKLEGREGLLEALAESAELVGAALEYLGAAHQRLDDQSAERLEEQLLARCSVPTPAPGPILASPPGTASPSAASNEPAVPPGSLKGGELIEMAANEAEGADEMLAGLQDDQAPDRGG